jgi:acetolactate synthase small subunit
MLTDFAGFNCEEGCGSSLDRILGALAARKYQALNLRLGISEDKTLSHTT